MANVEAGKGCVIIKKYGPWGGPCGGAWDDGRHKHVKAITVTTDRCSGLRSIQVDYVDDCGKVVSCPKHGGDGQCHPPPFELDSICGCEVLKEISGYTDGCRVKALKFKTNKKESPWYGIQEGIPLLSPPVQEIDGFFGRSNDCRVNGFIEAIGIYAIPQFNQNDEAANEEPKLLQSQEG
eukprot:Gb_41807 [translate_table: standard]